MVSQVSEPLPFPILFSFTRFLSAFNICFHFLTDTFFFEREYVYAMRTIPITKRMSVTFSSRVNSFLFFFQNVLCQIKCACILNSKEDENGGEEEKL